MQLLLARLLDMNPPETEAPKAANRTFRRFMELLNQPGPVAHRVFHYADVLGVSPQHLNTICRRVQGKSASKLITEHIVLNAKRYLLHTEDSITDIADRLGFTDASHFVKYFRKATGHTPALFRKHAGF